MIHDDAIGHTRLDPWRSVPALVDALNSGSRYPTFTIAAVRNYLAKRHENGLAQYCRKLGQKVLISQPGFVTWLENQPDTRDAA